MELNLKKLRKNKGMTQEELASVVGATKRKIGAWERGENDIPMDYAVLIADALDCTVDDIAGRSGSMQSISLDQNERLLINLYRNMDENTQILIVEQAKMYSIACDAKGKTDDRFAEVVGK